jgi:hypothetical protein
MSNIKRFISFTLTAFFIVSAVAVRAQDAGGGASDGGDHWKTQLNVIKDNTGPTGIDLRKKLLKDIGDAVATGDTSDDIYAALEYISKEGLANNTNRQGQVLNDYPSIRMESARELGKMGTAKAADILIQLCRNETVFDVQRELIIALGNIGINENGKTVEAIFSIPLLRRYKGRSTTDIDFERLVISAIDAFDKINKKNNGIGNKTKDVQEFLDDISRKQFPRRGAPVSIQDRAKQVLGDVLRTESQRNQGS